MKLFNKAKGFTLIELAVVMVVTGTLAAVAAPKLGGVTDSARGTTLEGLAAAMETTNTSIHNKASSDLTNGLEASSVVYSTDTLATTFGWLAATERNMTALVDLGETTTDSDGAYVSMASTSEYTVTEVIAQAIIPATDDAAEVPATAKTIFITYSGQEANTAAEGSGCYVAYQASYDQAVAPYIEVATFAC
jgi:MSHA pilin protein MshA